MPSLSRRVRHGQEDPRPAAVEPVQFAPGHQEDPAQQASVKPRLPQPAVLHHERYRPVAEQQADVATYNEAMAAFYAQQQMKVRGTWAVHSGKRVATPEALTGRDRLKEALQALGFPLK